MNIKEILKNNPLIAAAQHDSLQRAVKSKVSAVFLMEGKLNSLMENEFQVLKNEKPIFIHTDLLKGLSNDKEAVDFIKKYVNPAGIVSTKGSMIKAAKKRELLTVQRIFLIDSKSLRNAIESIKENNPDVIEVMPALASSIVEVIKKEINKPVILGGLIDNEAQIISGLNAGADGVSFSKDNLWNYDLNNWKEQRSLYR